MSEQTENAVNAVNTKDNIRVVTSNDFIVAVGLEDLSLKARKLLYLAISQCKQTDSEFFEFYVTASEFAKLMNISAQEVYQEADRITDELLKTVLRTSNHMTEKRRYFDKYTVFSRCAYRAGVIYIKLNKDMTDFLLKLKGGFTQPLLFDFIRMKSNYSIAVWHLMQREMMSRKPSVTETIEFTLTLEELRNVTATTDKFVKLSHFKDKVLNKAIREIEENCAVNITYENVKRGRTVVAFNFKAQSIFFIDKSKVSPRTLAKVRYIRQSRKGE